VTQTRRIAVYGPTGYTGRQVVTQLRRLAVTPVLVGRDERRLRAVRQDESEDIRVADLADPVALRRGFEDTAAVINCVGPFVVSADRVAGAALDVGAHYLDFTAEQEPVLSFFEKWDEAARAVGKAILPALGFFGGLADLMSALAADGASTPTAITIAYAVSGWLMTRTSRATAATIRGRRWVRRDGELRLLTGDPQFGSFAFPGPLGMQPVMEDYPVPEVVTIPQHLEIPDVRVVMTASTLRESFGPDAPDPDEISDEQRAGSSFAVAADLRCGTGTRQVIATGKDIYGITAPMIVHAAMQLTASQLTGVVTPSQTVDARSFLESLHVHGLRFSTSGMAA
jgi:short subunit dehydrogenase-like uncharacterized protein